MIFGARKIFSAAMPDIRLNGPRVHLRPPMMHHWSEWGALRLRNRDYLKSFEPSWRQEEFGQDYFRRRVEKQAEEWNLGRAHSFLIFKNDMGAILGGMNVNNICRGAAQYASLGYWIDETHQGQGLMAEALEVILAYGFKELKLQRMNAACLPHNERRRIYCSAPGSLKRDLHENISRLTGNGAITFYSACPSANGLKKPRRGRPRSRA